MYTFNWALTAFRSESYIGSATALPDTENGSKNRSGGLFQLRVENKVVPIYTCKLLGERCHVYLLDKYISKLPPKAFEMDCFYMRPLDQVHETSSAWFSC